MLLKTEERLTLYLWDMHGLHPTMVLAVTPTLRTLASGMTLAIAPS